MHGTFDTTRRARIVRRLDTWTFRESEILRENWPDEEKLSSLLPHRKWSAIRGMAKRCGLIPKRVMHVWTAAQNTRLKKLAATGMSRREIAREMGLTFPVVRNRLKGIRLHLARRPPKPSSNPLVCSIRQRAFCLGMTLIDLDRSLGGQEIFQHGSGRTRVALVHIDRAVKALGGRLVVEWDE